MCHYGTVGCPDTSDAGHACPTPGPGLAARMLAESRARRADDARVEARGASAVTHGAVTHGAVTHVTEPAAEPAFQYDCMRRRCRVRVGAGTPHPGAYCSDACAAEDLTTDYRGRDD